MSRADRQRRPTDPQQPGADITLGWTNAGRRAGAGDGAPSGGSADAASRARATVRLTSGPDHFDPIARGVGSVRVRYDFSHGLLPPGLLILARAGDDLVIATYGSDHVEGEAGNDTLRGAAGNDLLFGRTGDDPLLGDDDLEGGRGRDRMQAVSVIRCGLGRMQRCA